MISCQVTTNIVPVSQPGAVDSPVRASSDVPGKSATGRVSERCSFDKVIDVHEAILWSPRQTL
jgi:hypothetical protein